MLKYLEANLADADKARLDWLELNSKPWVERSLVRKQNHYEALENGALCGIGPTARKALDMARGINVWPA